jgi:hypothetical protein
MSLSPVSTTVEGNIFAEYRRSGSPARSCSSRPRRCDGAYFDGEFLALFRGVVLNGERTGSIALVFDLRGFRSRLLEYAKIAALVVVLVSVLMLHFLASLYLAAFHRRIPWCNWPQSPVAFPPRRITRSALGIRSGGETGLLVDFLQ